MAFLMHPIDSLKSWAHTQAQNSRNPRMMRVAQNVEKFLVTIESIWDSARHHVPSTLASWGEWHASTSSYSRRTAVIDEHVNLVQNDIKRVGQEEAFQISQQLTSVTIVNTPRKEVEQIYHNFLQHDDPTTPIVWNKDNVCDRLNIDAKRSEGSEYIVRFPDGRRVNYSDAKRADPAGDMFRDLRAAFPDMPEEEILRRLSFFSQDVGLSVYRYLCNQVSEKTQGQILPMASFFSSTTLDLRDPTAPKCLNFNAFDLSRSGGKFSGRTDLVLETTASIDMVDTPEKELFPMHISQKVSRLPPPTAPPPSEANA